MRGIIRTASPAAVVLLAALIALAGCGNKGAPVGQLTPDNPQAAKGPGAGAGGAQQAAAPGQEVVVDVYIPCAFGPASTKIAKLFEAANPGVRLNRTVENVSVLAPKIAAGAKPDVFMCNGDIEITALEQKGCVEEKRDVCFTSLVLVVAKANPAAVKDVKDLARPAVKSIAVATADTSVGYYAEKILKDAGIWGKVQGKLVRPRFPVELMKLAAQGKVQASMAYATCFRSKEGEHQAQAAKLKLITDYQEATCLTIACQSIVVKGCKSPEIARKFLEFLTTPDVQKILADSGFMTLAETKCYDVPGEGTGGAGTKGGAPAAPAAPAPRTGG
jgi:molybdenum ABC transporter molybdate-binding protein